MARLRDLRLRDRLFLRAYRFRTNDPVPLRRLPVPLARARVALVTSAGVHLPDDLPFDDRRGGDASYRVIPRGADLARLRCSHPSSAWDRSGLEEDANLVLPLERLEELAREGVIGSVAPRHIAFQGSISAPARLRRRSAPEMARILERDGVHAAVLVPV